MKKKLISTALILGLMMTLCSCGQKDKDDTDTKDTQATSEEISTTEETTEMTTELTTHEEVNSGMSADAVVVEGTYEEIIKKYQDIFMVTPTTQELLDNDMSIMFSYYESPLKETGYIITDVDGNGVEELVIGQMSGTGSWEGLIIEMYTMVDGKVVRLLSSQERDRFFIMKDGTVANEASSSAADSWCNIYNIEADGTLGFKEGIYTTLGDEAEAEYFVPDNAGDDKMITGDEYFSKLSEYEQQYDMLDLTPIADFK